MSEAPERLLIVAPNWLGDAVMALPAIADARRHFATASLVVAARAHVADMFRLAPGVDEVIRLCWRGRVRHRRGWREDVEAIRRAACDTAILLPNSFASAWLVRRAGVRRVWGYASDMRRLLLTRAVPLPRGSMHQSKYYQHLMQQLGVENTRPEPVLDVPQPTIEAASRLLRQCGCEPERPMAVLAPGAAYGTAKQWTPGYFCELIVMLARERGVQSVLVGSAADAPVTAGIASAARSRSPIAPVDLAGATDLQTLAAVMQLARVCVSNDSGAMHLAAAVGTPVAALFGPTREYETAPLVRGGSRAEVLVNPVACRPCMLRECPIDHRCMTGLRPDRVVSAVTDLMTAWEGRSTK